MVVTTTKSIVVEVVICQHPGCSEIKQFSYFGNDLEKEEEREERARIFIDKHHKDTGHKKISSHFNITQTRVYDYAGTVVIQSDS